MARTPQRKYTYSLSNKTSKQVRDFMNAHENDSFPSIMETLVADHYALNAIKNGANPDEAIAQAQKNSQISASDSCVPDDDALKQLTKNITSAVKVEETITRKGIVKAYDDVSTQIKQIIAKQNEPIPEPTVSPDSAKIDEILSILHAFDVDGVKAKNISEIESAARADTGEAIDDTNLDLIEAILGNGESNVASSQTETESVRAAVSKVGDDSPFDGNSGDSVIANAIATAESTDDLTGDDVDFSGFDFNQEPDDDTKKEVESALQAADERKEIASGKYDEDLKNILG